MFKVKIYSDCDYSQLMGRLKKRIDNRHFFKGYFDKNESVVYYYSDTLPNPMDTNQFPLLEVKICNLDYDIRRIEIEIKVVRPILIIFGAIIQMLILRDAKINNELLSMAVIAPFLILKYFFGRNE